MDEKVPAGAIYVLVTKMPDNASFAQGKSVDGKTEYHLFFATPALKKRIHLQQNNVLIGSNQAQPDGQGKPSGKFVQYFLVTAIYEPTDCI